jgi:catechol 2,3-dioxygenase-like lactoylglutathione lyase family enzyme
LKRVIAGFDHVAITVADLDATCRFFSDVLDAVVEETYTVEGRVVVKRVRIGGAVFNIHQQGNGIGLVARHPTPGSADICLRWEGAVEDAEAHLETRNVAVVEGPVARTTAENRPSASVYFRDLDGNLIELMAGLDE